MRCGAEATQILDVEEEKQEGSTHNEQNAKKSKCAVIKTSTRQVRPTRFCPSRHAVLISISPDCFPAHHRSCAARGASTGRSHRREQGLVSHPRQAPSGCVWRGASSCELLLELWRRKLTVFAEYDARVKAMEVDERPTETYTDIGGLDKQIEELVEAM